MHVSIVAKTFLHLGRELLGLVFGNLWSGYVETNAYFLVDTAPPCLVGDANILGTRVEDVVVHDADGVGAIHKALDDDQFSHRQ